MFDFPEPASTSGGLLEMPIIKGTILTSFPLLLLEPYRAAILIRFGRTLELTARYRGMTGKELWELFNPQTFNRPASEVTEEQAQEGLVEYLRLANANTTYLNIVTIPDKQLRRMEEALRLERETLTTDYAATPHLRWACPEGTHTPDATKLQQRFDAKTVGGGRSSVWRNVPTVVVKKGREHE